MPLRLLWIQLKRTTTEPADWGGTWQRSSLDPPRSNAAYPKGRTSTPLIEFSLRAPPRSTKNPFYVSFRLLIRSLPPARLGPPISFRLRRPEFLKRYENETA